MNNEHELSYDERMKAWSSRLASDLEGSTEFTLSNLKDLRKYLYHKAQAALVLENNETLGRFLEMLRRDDEYTNWIIGKDAKMHYPI